MTIMRPLPFVWPYALGFWMLTAILWWPEFRLFRRARRQVRTTQTQDRRSLQVIMVSGQVTSLAAIACAFFLPATAIVYHRVWWFAIGLGWMAAGGLLRQHCFRMLGTSFTGAVTVRPDQEIVQRGAYRWVRHPSYTAGILLTGGLGLALGNWLSTGLLMAGSIVAYIYRVRVEEQALLATLGERYAAYMKRTKRFVPYIV